MTLLLLSRLYEAAFRDDVVGRSDDLTSDFTP